jgi:agmatine deiminase
MTRPPLPEWSPHEAVWIGFPSDPELWVDDLAPAQEETAAFARAVWADGKGEEVRLVAADETAAARARGLAPFATLIVEPFGDIWLRDTGAIVLGSGADRRAIDFDFNGWGGKYELEHDDTVAAQIAKASGADLVANDFILEGGAVDHDGAGTVLTTGQCVLNPNRNPGWNEATAQAALAESLGARKVLWLGDGLKNDHTDGHVDNIARFVAPGRVVCQAPAGPDDPNAEILNAIAASLEKATDAMGRKLDVVRIPGVGLYRNALGEISPASHMNFLIANDVVVVPIYGTATEADALSALQAVFPTRAVVGVSSRGLLGCGEAGGGSFHCITQQEPL